MPPGPPDQLLLPRYKARFQGAYRSQYRKCCDKARPPFQRLWERDDISGEYKAAVLALKNPTDLLEQQGLLNRAIENPDQYADTF
jgi:hypothetical protein